MKGEVKDLEGSDGRLLDCFNKSFGIIALTKITRYGLCDGLSTRAGGMGDSPTLHPNWLRSAPSPLYDGHWSLFSTQSNWSEHESYYYSSPSIAKTGNI
jgi:hypothetical protein